MPSRTRITNDHGVTLIELLIVIMLLGIIFSIAWAGVASRRNLARQAEAYNLIGAINRSQQAYFVEHHAFAPNLDLLELKIKKVSSNYTYTILVDPLVGSTANVQIDATPLRPGLRGVRGCTLVAYTNRLGDLDTTLISPGPPGQLPSKNCW